MDVDKVWKRVVARTQYEIPRGKLIQILSIGSAPITVEEAVRSRAPYLRGRITSGTGLALAPHLRRMPGRGRPNRKEPSDPQHQGIEREKDDETGVATKLTLDNKPDEIVSEVADHHESDGIDNQ